MRSNIRFETSVPYAWICTQSMRESVIEAGLEFTPVEVVADTAWAALTSPKLHHLVGKTARRVAFAARWMPGRLRKGMTRNFGGSKA